MFVIILMGTFNSWVLSLFFVNGGDANGKEGLFNLFFNHNHPFTYSITFCNTKLKDAPNSTMI